jgi:hypothetical protein
MIDDMGTFRTTIMIESAEHRGETRTVENALVHAAGARAPDFVVFGHPGGMVLLGARSLEGLNVRVDAQRKQLVPAGPILAGVAD